MNSEDDDTLRAPIPVPLAEVPVLRDVVASPAPAAPAPRPLTRDARAALGVEAAFLVDEVLDEFLPRIEARLRERLDERIRAWLESDPAGGHGPQD